MRIGEVAAAGGCHLETLRYYERIGLLDPPPRTSGGYRDYRREDVDRLQFITRGRGLGFSIEEIRNLLRLSENAELSCAGVDELARKHLDDVRAKLRDLRRMAAELERTIVRCHGGRRGDCVILESLRCA